MPQKRTQIEDRGHLEGLSEVLKGPEGSLESARGLAAERAAVQ